MYKVEINSPLPQQSEPFCCLLVGIYRERHSQWLNLERNINVFEEIQAYLNKNARET